MHRTLARVRGRAFDDLGGNNADVNSQTVCRFELLVISGGRGAAGAASGDPVPQAEGVLPKLSRTSDSGTRTGSGNTQHLSKLLYCNEE